MTKSEATQIAAMLDGARRVLITSHRDPDGDSLGSQMAFYEYWTKQKKRRADVVDQGTIPSKYNFLDPQGVIRSPKELTSRSRYDAAMIFECSSLDRIGSVTEVIASQTMIINIDHHQYNTGYGSVNVIDSKAAACGVMVFDLLSHWGAEITPFMAQCLATAIVTDTGRFSHSNTNQRAVDVTARLIRLGADLSVVAGHVYQSLTPAAFRLVHQILSEADLRSRNRMCFLKLRIADRRKFKVPYYELEGLVDQTMSIDSVQFGVLLKELGPHKTKASLRSVGAVDVAALARRFGGGGHHNAAGCVLDLGLDEAADTLARAIGPLSTRRRRAPAKGRRRTV